MFWAKKDNKELLNKIANVRSYLNMMEDRDNFRYVSANDIRRIRQIMSPISVFESKIDEVIEKFILLDDEFMAYMYVPYDKTCFAESFFGYSANLNERNKRVGEDFKKALEEFGCDITEIENYGKITFFINEGC